MPSTGECQVLQWSWRNSSEPGRCSPCPQRSSCLMGDNSCINGTSTKKCAVMTKTRVPQKQATGNLIWLKTMKKTFETTDAEIGRWSRSCQGRRSMEVFRLGILSIRKQQEWQEWFRRCREQCVWYLPLPWTPREAPELLKPSQGPYSLSGHSTFGRAISSTQLLCLQVGCGDHESKSSKVFV